MGVRVGGGSRSQADIISIFGVGFEGVKKKTLADKNKCPGGFGAGRESRPNNAKPGQKGTSDTTASNGENTWT